MTEPNRSTGIATAASITPVAGPLVGALLSLYRAYQKTSIYPPGHPAVPAALTQAIGCFESLLGGQESIVVRVSRGDLLFEDEPLADSGETLGALGQLLYDLDVASIEFHAGLSLYDLETFIHEVGRAKRDGLNGVALAEALDHGRPSTIELRAVDYGALQFTEGARDPLDKDTRREVWDNLPQILTDPETAPVELTPTELAAEITEEITTREGTGVGQLKQQMHRINRTTRDLTPEQQRAVQERVSSFVSALSPKLRQDLLRVDPGLADESLELMTQLADGLPESDLLRALRQLDSIGARLPDQLLTLMNKLVRISGKHPTLIRNLKAKLESWGIAPETLTGPPGDLQSALQEVFRRRTTTDYIPQPHKVLLDDLSRHRLGKGDFAGDSRYRDPQDMHDVRLHAAQVASKVVGGRGGGPHRAGIFAYLASSADALIERGHFDVLHDTAVSARTYSLLKTESENTRNAARGFLNEFKSEDRLQKILERGFTGKDFSKDALNLLALGGPEALDRVLTFLEAGPPPGVGSALEDFAKSCEPKLVAQVLEGRRNGGWQALKWVFPLLRGMQTEEALPLLESLLDHEESRARREALGALCDIDRRPGTPLKHLRRALIDESLRVAALGIQRLVELEDGKALELLGAYAEGALVQAPLRLDLVRRAAQSMLQRDEAGIERLCRSLESLGRGLRPGQIRAARVVSDVLKTRKDHDSVRRCLRRWRFTPSGLVDLVLPGNREAGTEEKES